MSKIFPLILIVFALMFVSTSEGAFQDVDFDARSAGMGGAPGLVDGGLTAASNNVAALGFADDIQIGLTHSSIFADLVRAEFIGISLPFGKLASLGLWGSILGDAKGVYSERMISVGYAVKPASNLALGLAVKFLRTGYDLEDEAIKANPYFSKTSASAFTGDIGVAVNPSEGLFIGISLQNVIPTDVSVSSSGEDQVPVIARASISYKFSSIASGVQQEFIGKLLSRSQGNFELSQRSNDTTIRLGVESWPSDMLAVRFGYAYCGGKLQGGTIFSLGGGLNLKLGGVRLTLDYAYQTVIGDLVDNTSHRISSTFIF
ncbi:type IX secretion system membrane protein PorP/SprF [Candidatus Poribacteria bacterium]|nr:type IX secretion system membrane protein PorP/SprF [Candidatus Poribacteria bacterium]